MTAHQAGNEYYQVIIDESYDAVICAIKSLAHAAVLARKYLSKIWKDSHDNSNFRKFVRETIPWFIDSIDSFITRSKNTPQYAYSWGLPLAVINEASRISEYKARILVENTIACNPSGEILLELRDKRSVKLPSTDVGYALHLGVLGRVINRLHSKEIIRVSTGEVKSLPDLLLTVKNSSSNVLFESVILESLGIIAKIVPALLNTISDKYDNLLKSSRGEEEELPCILRSLAKDLLELVGFCIED